MYKINKVLPVSLELLLFSSPTWVNRHSNSTIKLPGGCLELAGQLQVHNSIRGKHAEIR